MAMNNRKQRYKSAINN